MCALLNLIKSAVGGKLTVLSSSLPSLGTGALKNREDPKLLGTSKVCLAPTNCDALDFSHVHLGINLVATCFIVLQDVCHRLFTSTGFCRYVLVQRFISRCSNPWYAVSRTLQNVLLMNHFRLSTSLHGWPNLLLPCL